MNSIRTLRILFVFFSSLVSACAVVSYEPELDFKLTDISKERLIKEGLFIEDEGQRSAAALNKEIAPYIKEYETSIIVKRPVVVGSPFAGFQCFEPYLYVLTLGVIPAHCHTEYVTTVLIKSPNGDKEYSTNYHLTTMQGWFPMFLAFLPGWYWDIKGRGVSAPIIHTVNRAINITM